MNCASFRVQYLLIPWLATVILPSTLTEALPADGYKPNVDTALTEVHPAVLADHVLLFSTLTITSHLESRAFFLVHSDYSALQESRQPLERLPESGRADSTPNPSVLQEADPP